MVEDKVSVSGEQLTASVQSSWDQFIRAVEHCRELDQIVTMLAKHVRDGEMRRGLARSARLVFLKSYERKDAEYMLGRFYVRLVEAVASSYDRLSPLVFPALMSAPNSQVISFPTDSILHAIYGTS